MIAWLRARVWFLDRRVGWCDRRTEIDTLPRSNEPGTWHPPERRQTRWPRRFVDRNRTRACFCRIPPEGWRCTRGAGHTGPCAAVPVYGSGKE